mgnify:CR=1 FL=1
MRGEATPASRVRQPQFNTPTDFWRAAGGGLCFTLCPVELTPDMFAQEIDDAVASFDRYIVCLDKSVEECRASLESLLLKAVDAYKQRAPGLRHGIALDRQVTIILSQVDDEDIPLCGIYFNLHSPYRKPKPVEAGG